MLKTVGNPSTRFGDQTINNGDVVISTAGKGIDFSANTHAAGMTSETLTWYEEGTFTPTITCATLGNLSITYSAQIGRYTRIGNRVFINATIVTNTFTHTTASNGLRLTGLPFASNGTSNNLSTFSLYFTGATKAGYTQFVPYTDPGTSFLLVGVSGSGASNSSLSITDLPSGGTVAMIYSGHYEI